MKAFVVGAGAVGGRVARTVVDSPACHEVVIVEQDHSRAELAVRTLGPSARMASGVGPEVLRDMAPGDVVILAHPDEHAPWAEVALQSGGHAVSVSNAEEDVRALLALDAPAQRAGCHLVVGAGFSPGLSCVLALHAASIYDQVEEIHVARVGTGGPGCAQLHHRLLHGRSLDWRDGQWVRAQAGTGRELCWFPDPVGGRDCYRAQLPDALLLVPALPGLRRVTSRLAATRRDRITRLFPMMRNPHPEGLVGAIRIEVRGRRGRVRDVTVYGAYDRPALAAGVVAAVAGLWASAPKAGQALDGPGAGGLAQKLSDPSGFLAELALRGVRAATFVGGDQ
ncbi:MAG: hypothetical protein ACRD0I_08835 [Acidimicrobiales bacterium]